MLSLRPIDDASGSEELKCVTMCLKEEMILGRQDFFQIVTDECVHVSRRAFSLRKGEQSVTIKNLHANRIKVNDVYLAKDAETEVKQGDVLSLLVKDGKSKYIYHVSFENDSEAPVNVLNAVTKTTCDIEIFDTQEIVPPQGGGTHETFTPIITSSSAEMQMRAGSVVSSKNALAEVECPYCYDVLALAYQLRPCGCNFCYLCLETASQTRPEKCMKCTMALIKPLRLDEESITPNKQFDNVIYLLLKSMYNPTEFKEWDDKVQTSKKTRDEAFKITESSHTSTSHKRAPRRKETTGNTATIVIDDCDEVQQKIQKRPAAGTIIDLTTDDTVIVQPKKKHTSL